MNKMKGSRHQAGFSLIEVMVAILILGIALAGLTTGITTALGSSKESEQQSIAVQLAAGQMETLRTEGGLTDGETSGDFGAAFAGYRWRQTIQAAGVDGLHEVAVNIESAQDKRTIYELKTLLFEPADDTSASSKPAKNKKKRSADK